MSVGDGVDEGVKVEGWEVRVLSLDIHHGGNVVPRDVHVEREGVVQVREGDSVLCSDWLTDNYLVDVVKLIPVFISAQTQQTHTHTNKHSCMSGVTRIKNAIVSLSFFHIEKLKHPHIFTDK